MGNPQCVVLGPLPDAERFDRLGPALSTHPMFPAGTNVEFAHVEAPDRVRILIWERGVGPTTSSGTGTSASAVAAAAHGGAARDVDVVAPGGTQRVEWRDDGVSLTGWAEIVLDGQWLASLSDLGLDVARRPAVLASCRYLRRRVRLRVWSPRRRAASTFSRSAAFDRRSTGVARPRSRRPSSLRPLFARRR